MSFAAIKIALPQRKIGMREFAKFLIKNKFGKQKITKNTFTHKCKLNPRILEKPGQPNEGLFYLNQPR